MVVSAGDEIELRVTDDGKGMDEGVLESGLGNMRERAHKHGGTFVGGLRARTRDDRDLDRAERSSGHRDP